LARITVLGAGVCGLAAGMLLARDRHDVVVLERDAARVPESPGEAWERWDRAGVAQFQQPHYLQPRARHVLDAELPDVRDALTTAGALRFDTLATAPPSLPRFEGQADDERFVTITARRPTLEQVFARAAAAEPRLEIRRGVAVSALVTRTHSGVPHVVGVRTESGEELRADLVVDAMGRRSPLPRWLETVTLFGSSADRPLTQLRHADRWTAVVAACPLHAHWLDGERMTDVLPMAGILDRHRRLVVDGRPVITGLAVVADAWACTNPSLGRGIALGLLHTARLRDVARTELEDPQTFALAWDRTTESELTPWYRATVAIDRARLAEIEAIRTGAERPRTSDPPAVLGAALVRAMAHDPDIFRAFMEIAGCLTLPGVLFARPGLAERVLEVAGHHESAPPPGPTRDELLRLIA
jgi:2-polyprenyl-6-methoxyphenol hydroxylase-like FAD-dependent oxidoreductase